MMFVGGVRGKRGDIAQTITTIPVMVLVAILMILFVGLSVLLGAVKGPEEATVFSLDSSFLFRELELKGEKMSVIDATVKYWRGEAEIYEYTPVIQNLVDKEGYCLAMALGNDKSPAGGHGGVAAGNMFVSFKDGARWSANQGKGGRVEKYERAGLLTQIHLLDKNYEAKSRNIYKDEIYVQYYYGRCLDE